MTRRSRGQALDIGAGILFDPDRLEDMIAIVGRRGRGKTNTGVVLVEELHELGGRFVVADPTGVWHGLKSSKNGKAPGIPVVVMGGEHGDVPLEDTAGKVIADFVADPSSPSVILDFRGFRKGQMARFMTDFLEQLYHRNRHPLHVVLDEADQFAPQRVMGETARLVGAAEDVCKMGRAKGLLPIVITQRPAALNKNVLTQAGLLIAHQLTGPQDQKAVDDWIRANADEEQRKEFMATIATLERGEAWFWQPEIPVFQRVHVRARRTFDSSATPKRGEKRVQPKAAAKVDLDALKERIASTIERARAEDPRELRKQIADLKAQLAKAAPAAAAGGGAGRPDRKTEAALRAQRLALEAAMKFVVEISAQEFFKEGGAVDQAEILKALDAAAQGVTKLIERKLEARNQELDRLRRDGLRILKALKGALGDDVVAVKVNVRHNEPFTVSSAAPRPLREAAPRKLVDGVGKGETQILTAVAQHPDGVTREQLTVLTGYKRSSRDTYLQRLRAAGYVDQQGELLLATDAGVAALGSSFEPLPTGPALRDHWLDRLPAGERKILEALIGAHPSAVDRGSLDVGFKRSSRDTYIQRLAARQLVKVERGEVRASDNLF